MNRKYKPDWDCYNCVYKVFGSKDRSGKCGKSKNNSNDIYYEPGDWKCECGETNFKRRVVCRKCGSGKDNNSDVSQPSPNQPLFEVGDWICKFCNIHNFKKRSECKTEGCQGTIQKKKVI